MRHKEHEELSEERVDLELWKIKFEIQMFGRPLLVGTGESDMFWRALSPKRRPRNPILRFLLWLSS